MVVPPHHFDDEPAENRPGGLLDELERRQNDVLSQLDDLDAKLSEVLSGLEPSKDSGDKDGDQVVPKLRALLDETLEDASESHGDDDDDFGPADDWA